MDQKMKYTVCAYYTKNTLYETKAQTLMESLQKFNVPCEITAIDDLGDWYTNTCYKPVFLQSMLEKHTDKAVIYVDVDAEFMQYPSLFDTLVEQKNVHIGVYVFDRSCYKKSHKGFEVLSGTIFMNNTKKTRALVSRWVDECKANPRVWDQKSLEKVLAGDFYTLPGAYCKIFDRMDHITDAVIVHYQASREVRRHGLH